VVIAVSRVRETRSNSFACDSRESMNATKPQPARSVPNPQPAPVSAAASGARRAEPEAVKAPAEVLDPAEDDFEHHDTIPAPTWFDDGNEAGSS
jgi:hypothetical protein